MSPRSRVYPACSVFISYNHDTSAHIAGRIYERLCNRLGRDTVFKDNESRFRKIGEDFRKTFRGALDECRVVLVVIDPGWFDRRNEQKELGPDVPPDWVRLEVEAALEKQGLAVIPLMVDGADFPKNQKLPPSLADLRYRDGKRIHSDEGFGPSMDDLVTLMEPYLVEKAAPGRRWVPTAVAALVVLMLAVGGWIAFSQWNGRSQAGKQAQSTPVQTAPQEPVVKPETQEKLVQAPDVKAPAPLPPAPVTEIGHVLTMQGEEVTKETNIGAIVHAKFTPGMGMTVEMLFDNGGEGVQGPLTCVWLLPKSLEPAKSLPREVLNEDQDKLTWKLVTAFTPDASDGSKGIDKGAASKSHGYQYLTPFCPLEPGIQLPMGTPTRIGFTVLRSDGVPVISKRFNVVLSPDPLPSLESDLANPRIDVFFAKDQLFDIGGWTLAGTIGNAIVDWPASLNVPAKARNVGVPPKESVTTVWFLPEALRPMKSLEQTLEQVKSERPEKAVLPWTTWWSWVFNSGPIEAAASDFPMSFPLDPALFSREKEKPIEPGVYHAKLAYVRNADFENFRTGKLQKRPLWEKDFSIRVSQPGEIAPRPAPFQLRLESQVATTSWLRVKAIAFKNGIWTGLPEYGVFMPVRVVNIGDKAIPGLKIRSEIFLPPDMAVDGALIEKGAMMRKLVNGEVLGFDNVSGYWNNLCLGPNKNPDVEIPKGGRMSLQTSFYVGKPDSLPNAQLPKKQTIVGLRLTKYENEKDVGEVLYSGHVVLEMEWKETLDQASFDALLNELPP